MKDLSKYGRDKMLHSYICFCLSLYSTESAVAAAVTKEVADKMAYGKWDWKDIIADAIGIILGTAVRVVASGRWNWF